MLKRIEGPFHRPHSSSSPPHHPPLFQWLAGWHCYHYTARIYGVRAYSKNKKASVNTCGKHSISPPLISYALIRHIAHRRDLSIPASRTFISNGPKHSPCSHLQTNRNEEGGGVRLLKLNTVGPYVSLTITVSPAGSVRLHT